MKWYIMFHLNYLLLHYETKDGVKVENSKVTKKSCLDLLHTSIAISTDKANK